MNIKGSTPVATRPTAKETPTPSSRFKRAETKEPSIKGESLGITLPMPDKTNHLVVSAQKILHRAGISLNDVNVGFYGEIKEDIDTSERLGTNIIELAPNQMMGGLSTGSVAVVGGGTLGGLFITKVHPKPPARHLFAVSNQHVYSDSVTTQVCQPLQSVFQIGTPNCVINHYRLAATGPKNDANGCCRPIGKIIAAKRNSNEDCAMIQLNDPDDGLGITGRCTVRILGDVSGRSFWSRVQHDTTSSIIGMDMEKVGARTHHTTAKVWATNLYNGAKLFQFELRGQAGSRGVSHRNSAPEFEDDPHRAQDDATLYPNCFSPASEPFFCTNEFINGAIQFVQNLVEYTLDQATQVVRDLWNHPDGPLITMAGYSGDSGSWWMHKLSSNNLWYAVGLHSSGSWSERVYSHTTRWKYPYVVDHANRHWSALHGLHLVFCSIA